MQLSFINNHTLSIALLGSLVTPLICFSMQTTIEIPDERIEDIIIYTGKSNLETLSSTAQVNKQWNTITNSPYVTKLLFFDNTNPHTAASKHYQFINRKLHHNIKNKKVQKVTDLLQDPFINPNYEIEWNNDKDIKSDRVMLESITPLRSASLVCNEQIINSLLHAKAHITGTLWSPINLVIASNSDLTTSEEKQSCIQTLIKHKANIQQKCFHGNGLHIAAAYGDSNNIPFLLTHIPDPNIKNGYGEIALLTLFRHRNNHNSASFLNATCSLLNNNSDIHAQDNQGRSVFSYTATLLEEPAYRDIATQLLERYNQG
ncbi:MAG TPA: ankyrin repeat domain-containing protein [Candidatus Babeliales bacterium]|jgi:ankyrin repeat protein|nr:ankyrin repeat domain-containing protein [Candidatus Babeliales bacterium]